MRKMWIAATLAIAVVVLGAAPAAHARGFYVGGSLGQTSADMGFGSSTPGISVDDSDTGFKLLGGYNIVKYFAVEGSWVDVAGISMEASDPLLGTMSASAEADGFAFEAVGILPIGKRFQLFADYGMYMWDGTTTVSASDPLIPSFSASDDGSDPTYGLGFGWSVIERGTLRFEAERYEIETMDVDMYSVGFTYSF